jgi:hypothetical protein
VLEGWERRRSGSRGILTTEVISTYLPELAAQRLRLGTPLGVREEGVSRQPKKMVQLTEESKDPH